MTTIKLKNGSGAPAASDLVQGEPALDLTNKRLYTEDSGGTVIEVGTNPTSLTTGTFTSTGIDDNATSTAITIDSSENVGIGTTSPSELLHLKTEGTQLLIEDTSSGNKGSLFAANTATVISSDPDNAVASSILQFQVDGSETMRIDSSGNVGIGTTSPSTSLDVVRAGVQPLRLQSTSGTEVSINMVNTGGNVQLEAHSGNFTIDADNVGIGTASPGSFNAAGLPFVVGGGSGNTGMTVYSGSGSAGSLHFADGTAGDASYRGYINYLHSGDSMQFGTSGLERLRIDSSGNVGIGTTSPNANIHIVASNPAILLQSSGAGTDNTLKFLSRNISNVAAYADIIGVGAGHNSTNAPIVFTQGSGQTERMRLDSSGRLGIGTSSHNRSLQIGDGSASANFGLNSSTSPNMYIARSGTGVGFIGTTLYNTGSGLDTELSIRGESAVGFCIGSSERARIDSSGTVNIGTTAASGTNGNTGLGFTQNGRTISNCDADWNYEIYGAQGNRLRFFGSQGGGTQVGSVTVTTSATSYNTSSDYRLKENIVDAPAGNIDAIRVRSFDWKDGGSHQTYGMIAQELVDVAPEAVSQGETEDDMWGVDYSKLVPMMIKEIQDLKAEVAALKGA